MLQILLYHLFRHLTYRGTKVPSRPEMPAPISLFQVRKLFKQLARRAMSRVNYFVRFGDNYNGRLNGSKTLRFLLVFFPVANAIDFNNRGVMDNAVDGSYRH